MAEQWQTTWLLKVKIWVWCLKRILSWQSRQDRTSGTRVSLTIPFLPYKDLIEVPRSSQDLLIASWHALSHDKKMCTHDSFFFVYHIHLQVRYAFVNAFAVCACLFIYVHIIATSIHTNIPTCLHTNIGFPSDPTTTRDFFLSGWNASRKTTWDV